MIYPLNLHIVQPGQNDPFCFDCSLLPPFFLSSLFPAFNPPSFLLPLLLSLLPLLPFFLPLSFPPLLLPSSLPPFLPSFLLPVLPSSSFLDQRTTGRLRNSSTINKIFDHLLIFMPAETEVKFFFFFAYIH